MEWFLQVMRKFADVSGRARRKELWMFTLVIGVANLVFNVLGRMTSLFSIVGVLFSLVVLVPSITVSIRRLHDTGRSGWWLLLNLVPFLGWAVVIYFFVLDGQPGHNQYGPNPKEVVEAVPG